MTLWQRNNCETSMYHLDCFLFGRVITVIIKHKKRKFILAMTTHNESRFSLFIATLSLLFLTGCTSNQAIFPPTTTSMTSFVLINKSKQAYTVFTAIPGEKEREVRSKISKRKSVFLVEWAEFSHEKDVYLSSNILKNEYQDSHAIDGILQLLERAPGVPFGLTWNGGIAYTYNDYQHAQKTYKRYRSNPADYERTRNRDPRADPVNPAWHLGPLLGW